MLDCGSRQALRGLGELGGGGGDDRSCDSAGVHRNAQTVRIASVP